MPRKNSPITSLRDIFALGLLLSLFACAGMPEPKHAKYSFPKERASIETPKRPGFKLKVLGEVKSKVEFPSLDPNTSFEWMCQNYFNRAAQKLVEYAKKRGADAVVEVRSVVILMDGKVEFHPRAECSDDGEEGQVLARGVAVKFEKEDPQDPRQNPDK